MSRYIAITALLGAALVSGAALAQAPRSVLDRPPAEAYPNLAGGMPQLQGEKNAQARRAAPDTRVLGAGHFPIGLNVYHVATPAQWDAYRRGYPSAGPRGAVPQPGEEPFPGGTPK